MADTAGQHLIARPDLLLPAWLTLRKSTIIASVFTYDCRPLSSVKQLLWQETSFGQVRFEITVELGALSVSRSQLLGMVTSL